MEAESIQQLRNSQPSRQLQSKFTSFEWKEKTEDEQTLMGSNYQQTTLSKDSGLYLCGKSWWKVQLPFGNSSGLLLRCSTGFSQVSPWTWTSMDREGTPDLYFMEINTSKTADIRIALPHILHFNRKTISILQAITLTKATFEIFFIISSQNDVSFSFHL